ncbi:MAG TPA: magnesium-translocating P-type ATPase [Gemmatimonadaceae bacterium]|nr:magnesium-translocating P-type ATPase [Gemmatimonadaceae bacterium]
MSLATRPRSILVDCAAARQTDVVRQLETSTAGLTAEEAARRLDAEGPNEIATHKEPSWPIRLAHTFRNPLVVLLAVLALTSALTGDSRAAVVMVLMIFLGVGLRFMQETRAGAAAAKLRAMVRVTSTVVRDGVPSEIPLREVVRGDLISLCAGDMIPADARILSAKDLFINQASLTGESMPVEKTDQAIAPNGNSPLELQNLCFLGTSVQSGTALAVAVATGPSTYFGGMAKSITAAPIQTAFDKGINRFTWLMIRFMAVMVPLVFLINGLTKHDWKEAFFFALAVAVGLTPEMLPMIVSVCLSRGAVAMSRERVIVKRLNAIQNFGAMDVLCTDKTGTLTMDDVILEMHCDVTGAESQDVLLAAALVSHFQTGLKNVLDRAILSFVGKNCSIPFGSYKKIDEVPFDFTRKLMSVVVAGADNKNRLIAKGAPEEIFRRCTQFYAAGEVLPIELAFLDELQEEYDRLSADGFRVLAVAYRDVPVRGAYGKDDECDLTLAGYVAFLDPPKETAAPALEALKKHGVAVKVLTGDNELVTRKICEHVGLSADTVVLGRDIETMSEDQLADVAERSTIFARLSPSHKQRLIQALQKRKHVVGFMGDGINDAAALHAADVGISVDTAVDVAKESADIILLEKSLLVLEAGVLEGRKVFSNIVKYVRMGASSNFGNMFSVLGASALLPFVPMAPIQVLTNNLLYDFSQVPIPTDNVDEEQIARPRPWDMGEISRFILFIGPISSIFDYTTYAIMWFIFGARTPAHSALFQTGWFVESLMTQTLIIHVIRTNGIPFFQSRASTPLIATTIAIMAIGVLLPISPVAPALGFVPLPGLYWPLLALTLLLYMALTQLAKVALRRRGWI